MWLNLVLISLLVICVTTDLKNRKIYNKVLLPAFVIAMIYHVITAGLAGLTSSILGALVGFSILLIPYFMGGMGAGDVKLLAVIGAIKGIGFVLTTAIFMAVAGGIIGLCILLFRKGVIFRLKQIFYFMVFRRQGVESPFGFDKEGLRTNFPYGVAIAIGALIAIYDPYKDLFLW
ncbi:A24 family peptidase [Pseudoneobacillus sp. C159]